MFLFFFKIFIWVPTLLPVEPCRPGQSHHSPPWLRACTYKLKFIADIIQPGIHSNQFDTVSSVIRLAQGLYMKCFSS
jgi:hypothetical protein